MGVLDAFLKGQEKESSSVDVKELLKRLKEVKDNRKRAEMLAALSDEEWEEYRQLRHDDDLEALAWLDAHPEVVPDRVLRMKVRTRLLVGVPVCECDAEVLRRSR